VFGVDVDVVIGVGVDVGVQFNVWYTLFKTSLEREAKERNNKIKHL